MINAVSTIAAPVNEPVLSYAPGTPERRSIKETLTALAGEHTEVPNTIAGERVRTQKTQPITMPHAHQKQLGTLHMADGALVNRAIDAALKAKAEWASASFDDRAAVFLKAADLLAGRYRARANAATMLGQSKTVHQAEIDAACELIDFWRFNVFFARRLLEEQPLSPPGSWNRLDWRPLDGFVAAITPFNFSSIGGNLPTAPAIMGNTVVWKAATTAALSAQVMLEILEAAGMPPGVINLVNAPGAQFGEAILKHPELAGVHFTGSTGTFNSIWQSVASNMSGYRAYPRLVGETGGKDFILAHASADPHALAVAMVRGAFEYQGQKCSAASRAYVPKSLWPEVSQRVEAEVNAIKMGDISDFRNFMGAVIDKKSFESIRGYIEAGKSGGAKVWLGGECNSEVGWFVRPTVVVADDPKHKLMREEIFGPVLTVYVYDDAKLEETVKLVDEGSPYALTGAIFARDRGVVARLSDQLRFSAGNFYINDKPTGAVVGQQPFGGSRASGTNDKAGSFLNLVRWTSARAIKETYDAPRSVGYPFMNEA
ncbi:MAG: L-glutamate gamma-semialdehyde dehydrogenase [Myxococcota bacterium]